ncbi:MAG: MASE1 domain-containing protein, partial [Patescibacteria group bacterium]
MALFLGYTAAGYLGLQFGAVNTFAAPIWLPTGIALAALLLGGYRLWPAIALGALAVNILSGAPLLVAIGIAVGNTLEALLGSYLISRLTSVDEIFRRPYELILFFISITLASYVSATIGVTVLWLAGLAPGNTVEMWVAWAFGDALGAITITPLFLTWLWGYAYPAGSLRGHLGEAVFLFLLIIAINALSFFNFNPAFIPDSTSLLFLSLIPLTWAAVRFGPRGTTLAIFVHLAIAVAATALGSGQFVATEYARGALFLQMYVATIAITFLIFAAIVKDLEHTGDKLTDYVRKLEYALHKIRSEDRAKTEFLAVLAHELRNPLAPVLSALELIKIKGLGSREAAHSIAVMDKQVRNATGLLDDLLDISRISERKISLVKEVIDVRTTLAHSMESVAPTMEAHQHTLTASTPDHPLMVDADPLRLEQILVNLLNNAAKYTNPGGTISVTATGTRERIAIRVRDNGIGIQQHMLTQIFEPFLQVSRDGAKRTSGLGIGLSLTKKLVELHGGTITATSAGIGKGSEFVVQLPAVTAPLPSTVATQQTPQQLPQEPTAHRVLIVDDNEPAAEGLGKLFQHRGSEVRLARDGTSAVEVAEAFNPTLVILDIGLPDFDGYQVIGMLQKKL